MLPASVDQRHFNTYQLRGELASHVVLAYRPGRGKVTGGSRGSSLIAPSQPPGFMPESALDTILDANVEKNILCAQKKVDYYKTL